MLQWWNSKHFRFREERSGGFCELHHEHGAGGEVRSVEKARSLRGEGGKLLELVVGKTRGAHHAIDARRKGDAQVALDDGRLREIDEHIEAAGMHGLFDCFIHCEHLRRAMRVDSAGHLHVIGCGHGIDHG